MKSSINEKLSTAKLLAFLIGTPIAFFVSLVITGTHLQAASEGHDEKIQILEAKLNVAEMEVNGLDRQVLLIRSDVDRNIVAVEKIDKSMNRANIILDRLATKQGIEIPDQID